LDKKSLDFGNITTETDATFEFNLKSKDKDKKGKVKSETKLPFQVTITYTGVDGTRCMRVISKLNDTTYNREESETGINVSTVAITAVQNIAKFALESKRYEEARFKLYSMQKLLQRAGKHSATQMEEYSIFVSHADELDQAFRKVIDKVKGSEDAVAKTLFKMKAAASTDFLAGAMKRLAVARRNNANEKLSEMFYNYRF